MRLQWFTNRMTIRVRLLLMLGLMCLALVAVPLTMYLRQSAQALQSARLEHAGVAPSHTLLRVIQLIQQHRGLSSGVLVLGGNSTMEVPRTAKQIETDKAIEAFDAIAASTLSDPTLTIAWRRVVGTWRRLATGVASRTISGRESVAGHTALIGDSLQLLDLLLDHFGLPYDPSGATFHTIMALLVHLPNLSEFLGQIRARGVLHLSQQQITPADRAALIGLISNVERHHGYVERELAKAVALHPPMRAKLGHLAQDSRALSQTAISLAQLQVVDAPQLRFPPIEYFTSMTRVIDGQFTLLEQALTELDGALQARIRTLSTRQLTMIGVIVLVIALAVWLGAMIVRALRQDIAALQQSEEAQRRHAAELEVTVLERTQELRAANTQLQEASRHKSEFLTYMSHELRTPLNAILGFSTILRDPAFGSLREEQAQYLTHIYSSGKHLLAIVNDLLDLAKVEAGKIELYPEPFTIITMLTAAMADVRPLTIQKHLTLALDTATAPTILTADPLRFKQIVYNLLSNAIKFTHEGGRITITARIGSKGEGLGVGSGEGPHAAPMPYALSPGEFVEIAVTDTGVGIPTEDMPKLFQPFIQLDSTLVRQYNGTGLGLALTKQLVELHGGWIRAVSEGIGCGSTFTVCFPSGARLLS